MSRTYKKTLRDHHFLNIESQGVYIVSYVENRTPSYIQILRNELTLYEKKNVNKIYVPLSSPYTHLYINVLFLSTLNMIMYAIYGANIEILTKYINNFIIASYRYYY